VLEHFTIGLLSELQQQVKYEQEETFDEVAVVAEKKEVNMEEVPRPTMQPMVKAVQFLTELELRKHPKMSTCIESTMEQMINQMNQLNLHLLQPRINKSKNVERDLLTIQCYKCRKMGHYSRECPNLPTLSTKENVGPFARRYSVEEKGKVQVHLIELMNEGREKALMGLEKSFKILKDVMDVMAQTK
jgi:hypothetical protein